ncbi:MAG: UDP-N-acetylmuramoyl-L-alanine--D-glutamate ligase [Bacteroides sp.]
MKERVVILGAGESGTGAAILAKVKGFETFVSDSSLIKNPYKEELNQHNIEWEECTHSIDKITNADLVIKSPGIPNTAPIIETLNKLNIPVISEIEFGSRYTQAKMICITGSNGKTTTTSLLYHLLKSAQLNVGLAGNIGQSLARQVAFQQHDYYVIELSSFQLDNMYAFRANIAILLNITPDHLDRYNFCMQKYIDAKFRIIQNQIKQDAFIYWSDDPVLKEEIKRRELKAKTYTFSTQHKASTLLKGGQISICDNQTNIPLSKLQLAGKHNLYNAMAALTASQLLGLSKKEMEKGLETFYGVAHRLEYVATVDDVIYINDSKATNIDSCSYALQAMSSPTILILGGKDKGNDYNLIAPLIKEKCKALVFLGADNHKLHDYFDNFGLPIVDTDSMTKAISEAHNLARKGDTVLLSPCCASFDLFNSYEHRGDLFKDTVKQLKQ